MWGLFGTILGLIGSMIISSRQTSATNRNIQQSLNAQKEENQLNREYNLELAQTHNEMNIEQWNRENAYNDPSAQMERMRNAGLNPDMMYGGGVSGNVAASSPSLTSGAPSSPMDWSALAGRKSIGDTINQNLNNRLLEAQIKNVEADTANKGSVTNLNNIQSQFQQQLLQGQINESALRIKLGENQIESVNRMDAQEIKESEARIKDYNQKAQESMARIQQISNSIKNDNARVDIEKQLSKSQIDKMASECELNYTQAYQINRLVESVARSYDDAHEVHLEDIGMLRINKGVLEFDAAGKTSSDWWLDDRNWLQNILRYLDQLTDSLDGILTPVTQIATRSKGGLTINNNL